MTERIIFMQKEYTIEPSTDSSCEGCDLYADESIKKVYDCPTDESGNLHCRPNSVLRRFNPEQDSVIESIRELLLQRSQTGIAKYRTTLDRTDLKPSEWCQHLLEELLDASGYVMRLKRDLELIEKLGK